MPPKLKNGDKENFNMILKAAKYNDLALVSAIRKADKL